MVQLGIEPGSPDYILDAQKCQKNEQMPNINKTKTEALKNGLMAKHMENKIVQQRNLFVS